MGEGRARLVVDVDIVRVARVVVLGLRVVVEIGILVAVVVVFRGRFWSLLWAWELDGLVPLGSSAV